MSVKKDIQLIKINKSLDFEFMIKEKYFALAINPLYEAWLSGTIITNENKNVLPKKILQHIDFRNHARYRLNEWNISSQFEYIVISFNMSLAEYYR